MSRDTFENTPLPHVSFGDTFSNPLPTPGVPQINYNLNSVKIIYR